jgi:Uma2 family endonuclease
MISFPEKVRITQAEFNRLRLQPEYRDRRVELWNGEIIDIMPTWGHGTRAAELIIEIGLYLRNNPIGVSGIEVQIELEDADYAPIPDLCVVMNRGDAIDPNEALPFMPDLVVEIQSPDQSDKFMREKAAWYVAHGCRMIITVFIKPIIEVLTPTDVRLLTLGDTLEGGDVLPGFKVAVEKLYPQRA